MQMDQLASARAPREQGQRMVSADPRPWMQHPEVACLAAVQQVGEEEGLCSALYAHSSCVCVRACVCVRLCVRVAPWSRGSGCALRNPRLWMLHPEVACLAAVQQVGEAAVLLHAHSSCVRCGMCPGSGLGAGCHWWSRGRPLSVHWPLVLHALAP